MTEYNSLEKIRLQKLDELRAEGIEAFPTRAQRTHLSKEAIAEFDAAEKESREVKVTVAGRIRAFRPMGKVSFAHIEDGAGKIQLFLRLNEVGKENMDFFNRMFDIGDFIQAEGVMFRTKTGEATVHVRNFRLLAKSVSPLPAAKDETLEDGTVVRHAALEDPELRARQRYADLAVNPEVRETFRKRAAIIKALRTFLDDHGFLEVETPILQPIYGGAAARPFVTYHNELEQQMYLRISFELYLKRLLVGGLERVYEIGHDFRNEGMDRTHNPEFTMLEFYQAYADYRDMMNMVESMIVGVVEHCCGSLRLERGGVTLDFRPPWPRVRFVEGLREQTGLDVRVAAEQELRELLARRRQTLTDHPAEPESQLSGGKLIDEVFKTFLEPRLVQPTFVIDYPKSLSPLARVHRNDSSLTERFELFIQGHELGNAFSELNDPDDQRARFEDQGRQREAGDEEAQLYDADYIRALEYGMPPAGGVGIGVDRLVMLLTDQPSIRDVTLFPAMRPEA